ncbi:MAG: CocE/NonD family hydrolase, partial [Pseudomonadota bacterium]
MIDEGYIFIAQDERGRFGSEGVFEHVRPYHSESDPTAVDDITDTHDTIDWALENVKGHNGCVGLNGNSYRGWHVMAGLIRPHPAVKAAAPSAACSEGFIGDDFFHNGAFALAQSLLFFTQHMDLYPFEAYGPNPLTNKYTDIDIYDFYLQAGNIENLRHLFPTPSPITDAVLENDKFNEYWSSREVRRHLHRTPEVAVLHVNNWYDVEDQYGTLAFYQEMKARDDKGCVKIASGPWAHGGWRFDEGDCYGPFHFGSPTAQYFRDEVIGPFFRHHLKGGPDPQLPGALMFDGGRNAWRQYDVWPPAGTAVRKLYFHADGRLGFEAPSDGTAARSYLSDPAHPVPYLPRPNRDGWRDDYRMIDQSFTADRDDVLVFSTAPLEEDIVLSGTAFAELYASSEGTDTDFVVKLIDAYPENYEEEAFRGYQRLVLGDIFRAKFRESYAEPRPLVPGEAALCEIPLLEQNYTFKKGHRIVAHVQSSWFPLFDRNPNTFTHIPTAAPESFQAVVNSIYMDRLRPSALRLELLES